MTLLDDAYFLPFHNEKDETPSLTGKKDTSNRVARNKVIQGPPLIFTNSYRDENKAEGIEEIVTSLLFYPPEIIVNDAIKNILSDEYNSNCQFVPTVYIDDQDNWHEDYWYLNFLTRLDCWDRERSIYTPPEDPTDPHEYADIKKFVLDQERLNQYPKEHQSFFQMGNCSEGFIFFHERIAQEILKMEPTGAQFIKCSDYTYGLEYKAYGKS